MWHRQSDSLTRINKKHPKWLSVEWERWYMTAVMSFAGNIYWYKSLLPVLQTSWSFCGYWMLLYKSSHIANPLYMFCTRNSCKWEEYQTHFMRKNFHEVNGYSWPGCRITASVVNKLCNLPSIPSLLLCLQSLSHCIIWKPAREALEPRICSCSHVLVKHIVLNSWQSKFVFTSAPSFPILCASDLSFSETIER